MPRRALVVLLALTAVSCTSARMIGRDVTAVAKAPAKEWKKVAAGAAVVGAALLVDDELARVARNNDSHAMDRVTETIEPFGGGASDKVIAGFLLYGVSADNDRARAVAFDSIVSSVIASKAITPALKHLTGRERPNGGDADAFPSNHATQAFAVASVIARHYEERCWVKCRRRDRLARRAHGGHDESRRARRVGGAADSGRGRNFPIVVRGASAPSPAPCAESHPRARTAAAP